MSQKGLKQFESTGDGKAYRSWEEDEIAIEIEKLQVTKKLFFNVAQYYKYMDWGLGAVGTLSTGFGLNSLLSWAWANRLPTRWSFLGIAFCVATHQYVNPKEEHLLQHKAGVEYNILFRKLQDASKIKGRPERDQAIKIVREMQDVVEREHSKFTPDIIFKWVKEDYDRAKAKKHKKD